jgi:HSP20 family protein
MHRVERTFGSFKRSIALPGEVDINKVDATFQKGVLKVVIPKPANKLSTVKKIPIKTK